MACIASLYCACPLTKPTRRPLASFQRYVPRLDVQGGFPLTPRRDLPSLHPGFSLHRVETQTRAKPTTSLSSSSNSRIPPPGIPSTCAVALSPFCLRLLVVQSPCSLCSVSAALRRCAQVREKIAQLVICGLWDSRDGDDDGIPLNPQRYYTIGERLHWACWPLTCGSLLERLWRGETNPKSSRISPFLCTSGERKSRRRRRRLKRTTHFRRSVQQTRGITRSGAEGERA